MTDQDALTQAIRRAAAQQAMIDQATLADTRIIDAIGIGHGKMLPCPICGKEKWKTRLRGSVYKCRTCGYERAADDQESADLAG